ncbi:MAG: hypothetical protein P4M00_06065 [Azospirillaceae bacterium]|nr:hypothetical protein [Azospirillaceae bacterium]
MAIDIVPGGIVSGESFFGRKREIADLCDQIERGRHLLLVSPRRVGKTSLLSRRRPAHAAPRPTARWRSAIVMPPLSKRCSACTLIDAGVWGDLISIGRLPTDRYAANSPTIEQTNARTEVLGGPERRRYWPLFCGIGEAGS